jgi:chlorobactene glucosyltransferase
MNLLVFLVALVLCLITLVACLNALTFPRLRRFSGLLMGRAPFISVLVPARDEAARIAATVRGLLSQDYPRFEVLILDDASRDGTAEIARSAAAGDDRLRILPGADLPPGWLGKNWACAQLAEQARGEVLVFTDADVDWAPGALTALMNYLKSSRADVCSVWPTQRTETWAERLVVPMMALAIVGYLPVLGVHYLPFVSMAAANGQCLAFRREAYWLLGGHEGVKASIIEDIALARRAKRLRLRLRLADGDGLISCRMYAGWSQVRDGYAKNILAGHGNVVLLALSTIFHWAIFLFPPIWLLTGWAWPLRGAEWPFLPLFLTMLGIGVRLLTAAVTRQRLRDALFLPLSVLAMTAIAFRAVWWQARYGGPQWKGRRIRI